MNYAFLADLIAVIHLFYACFVLFGLIAIVIGMLSGWDWVRNFPFRLIHLVCTVIVPLQSLIRITCPLTILENLFLRASGEDGYHRSFIGNLVNGLLYYDAPEWIFTVIYAGLAVSAILLFIFHPPTGSTHGLRWSKRFRKLLYYLSQR